MRLLWILIFFLAGCGTGPGAPLVRKTADDREGLLVPGCQNISSSDASLNFNPDNYLTTWASAWREGEAAGKHEGASRGFRHIGVDIQDEYIRAFAYGSLPDSAVFCRVFDAKPIEIYKIIESMIPDFGYRWEYLNHKDWLLVTAYVSRAHKPPEISSWLKCKKCEKSEPNSKWKDRFLIKIDRIDSRRSVVFVTRDVYIARRTKDGWSDYIKGSSVGYNEAVILNRIAQAL